MSKKQVSQLMDYVDKDGSGHVTYDEFKHYILEKADKRKGRSSKGNDIKDSNDNSSSEKQIATKPAEEKKDKNNVAILEQPKREKQIPHPPKNGAKESKQNVTSEEEKTYIQ